MTMKKFFSVIASAAVLSSAVCALNVNAEAETPEMPENTVAIAEIRGMMGTHTYYGEGNDGNSNNTEISPAYVNGNAKYESSITFTDFGTDSEQCVWLNIAGSDPDSDDKKQFTSHQYPDLKITVYEILADGVPVEFENNDAAYNLTYYDGPGHCRILLTKDTWGMTEAGLGLKDTPIETTLTVRFEVQGLYNEGTSNIKEIEPEYTLGDVDSSGAVDASDASLVLADYATVATGGASTLSGLQRLAGDVNKDEAVDSSDASTILAYYAYTATGGTDSLEDFMA